MKSNYAQIAMFCTDRHILHKLICFAGYACFGNGTASAIDIAEAVKLMILKTAQSMPSSRLPVARRVPRWPRFRNVSYASLSAPVSLSMWAPTRNLSVEI